MTAAVAEEVRSSSVSITDMPDDAMIDVEVSALSEAEAVAFLFEERTSTVMVSIVHEDNSMTSAVLDGEAFWAAVASLARPLNECPVEGEGE